MDDETLQAIDEYERTVVSSLISLKEVEDIWSPESKKPESKKSNWSTYVKSVHKELSKDGTIKVLYSKALQEASSRNRSNINAENLNKIRKEKVSSNRRKPKASVWVQMEPKPEVLNHDSLTEVYNYRITKLDDTYIRSSTASFKTLEKCMAFGLHKILEAHFDRIPYEYFIHEHNYKVYQNIQNEDVKIFMNSLMYTYYDKIHDESYREKIDIVDTTSLNKFCLNSLNQISTIVHSIYTTVKIDIKIHFYKNELL